MRRVITAREQHEMRSPWRRFGSEEEEREALPAGDDNDQAKYEQSALGGTPGGQPSSGPPAVHNLGVPVGVSPSATPSQPSQPSTSSGPGAPTPPGSGVDRWRPNVEEALRRNNMPVTPENISAVERQIASESSGDPNAINRTDSNAQAGHPSQGLLQTIPSTFNTYRLPGDPPNITDPQANLDAAINYHKNTYGPSFAPPGGKGIGSGHGY